MMLRLPIILTLVSCTLAGELHTIYKWKYFDYLYESQMQRDRICAENGYDYTQIFIIDGQKAKDGRIFVTTPADAPHAVPATLSTVSRHSGPGGPLLKPYPNWQWHNPTNCGGIISVRRVAIDDCNRIWVLDTGRIGAVQVCRAKYVVFDLKTDKLIKIIEIPDDISHSPRNRTLGRLSHPVVQTEGSNCEQTWVFASDSEGGGLVIYNGSNLWRLDDDVFHPEPPVSSYTIAGEILSGINLLIGLAMTPKTPYGSRRLFFRGLFELQQHSVLVDDLHKSTKGYIDICSTSSKYRFPSPIGTQGFSRDGIMFFGQDSEMAVSCWNVKDPLDAEHVDVVAQNNETLQFVSGVRITSCLHDPSDEELLIVTDRLQKVRAGTLNFNEFNFRILNASVNAITKGCKCEVPKKKSWSLLGIDLPFL